MIHVIPTYKSRAGVRADNDGTFFAFSSLIIIAVKPPCPWRDGWDRAEEGGWGRLAQSPPQMGDEGGEFGTLNPFFS